MNVFISFTVIINILLLLTGNSRAQPNKHEHLDKYRIVGGGNAGIGQAPYQISLQDINGNHFCGGAIINSRWIVTAAHCVKGDKSTEIQIMVGSNQLSNPGKIYYSDLLICHSRYNKPQYANDIALIRINTTIDFNKLVQPIDYSKQQLPDGVILTASGWGLLSYNAPSLPDKLQILNLKTLNHKICAKIIASRYRLDIGTLCTLNKFGQGMCKGDSGGPLVHDGRLVAISNWAFGCAKGLPDGQANIAHYHDWIRNNTNNN